MAQGNKGKAAPRGELKGAPALVPSLRLVTSPGTSGLVYESPRQDPISIASGPTIIKPLLEWLATCINEQWAKPGSMTARTAWEACGWIRLHHGRTINRVRLEAVLKGERIR